MLVTAGAIGAMGGQPVMGADGVPLPTGEALSTQCATAQYAEALVCSREPLAHVLHTIGYGTIGNMLGYAAFIALPSVILILLFGQTRIFFVMARDGLLPEALSKVHPRWKTPHVVTIITGLIVAVAAAFFPVGALADVANAGTLYAFLMVAIAVWQLRRIEPNRRRAFRVPAVGLVATLTIIGCLFLFFNLPFEAMIVLPIWTAVGLLFYALYGYRHSHVGRGLIEVHEADPDAPMPVGIRPPDDSYKN
jgi:APA family basic amino acid/polyamine antiporter